jgi:hypothetical protein
MLNYIIWKYINVVVTEPEGGYTFITQKTTPLSTPWKSQTSAESDMYSIVPFHAYSFQA